MDPDQPPAGEDGLSFLIPLGPDDEGTPESSGLHTPAPVRNAPPGPEIAKPSLLEPPGPPPLPGFKAPARPPEPLVILDSLGQPAPPPPPIPLRGASPPQAAPPPSYPSIPFSGPPTPSGGLEAAFFGRPPVDDKPFQPPPIEPIAQKPASPFEAPKLDAPVQKAQGAQPLPGFKMTGGVGGFVPPPTGPALGSFDLDAVAKAPANPFSPPVSASSPPPSPAMPEPVAPPQDPAPKPPTLPPQAVRPGAAQGAPGRRPGDPGAIPRTPLTAPPIRLPGAEPPAAKPFGSAALAPMPSSSGAVPGEKSEPGLNRGSGAPSLGSRDLPAAAREPGRLPAATGAIGFVELIECAGLLPFATRHVLGRFLAAPEPPRWLLVSHALVWVLASFIIRAGFALGKPSSFVGQVAPAKLGVAMGLGLGVAALLLLAAAAAVHALGRLSGGSGSYSRGLLIASILAPILALSAALGPIDSLWWAPLALSAYLLARALAGLYGAPLLQAGVIVAALALVGGAAEYKLRQVLKGMRESSAALGAMSAVTAATASTPGLAAAGPGGAMTAEQAAVLEQLQRAGALGDPGTGGPGAAPGAFAPPGQEPGPGGSAAAPGAAPVGPAGMLMPLLPAIGGGKLTEGQKAQLKAGSAEMLRKTEAVFNDPQTTQGMSPKERQQFEQLKEVTQAALRAVQGGPKPAKAETERLMESVQDLMKEMTEQPPQGRPTPAKKKRRRAPKPVEEQ